MYKVFFFFNKISYINKFIVFYDYFFELIVVVVCIYVC